MITHLKNINLKKKIDNWLISKLYNFVYGSSEDIEMSWEWVMDLLEKEELYV